MIHGRHDPNIDRINQWLSDDLLSKLFQYLTAACDRRSCSLVCKRWLNVIDKSHFSVSILRPHVIEEALPRFTSLRRLDFSLCTQILDRHIDAATRSLGFQLTDLNLSNNRKLTPVSAQYIGQRCTSLQSLTLTKCNIDSLFLSGIRLCKCLTSLNMSTCRSVSDHCLAVLASESTNLMRLNLRSCDRVTDRGVTLIALRCPKLTWLDLGHTKVAVHGAQALSRLPSLHHLCVSGCVHFSDDALMSMRNGCASLKNLDVSFCHRITNGGLAAFLKEKKGIQHLSLIYCSKISDSAMSSVPNLNVLKLDLCTIKDVGLHQLQGRVNLVEASFRRCSHLTDQGLGSAVRSWNRLQKLDLTCCREVADNVMNSLAAHCSDLRVLRLEGCQSVSAIGLTVLASSCTKIEELDCTDCNIDDAGAMAVSNCKNICSLKLGLNPDISDVGAQAIGAHCLLLQTLDLYRCLGIGSAGIKSILSNCRSIRELNVSHTSLMDESMAAFVGCVAMQNVEMRGLRVSNQGLTYVAMGCPNLIELDIKHCKGVGDMGLLAVAKYCRDLRQINASFCSCTGAGLEAIAGLECMGNMKLVHCRLVSGDDFNRVLPLFQALKKVKLSVNLKDRISAETLKSLEERCCRVKWVLKDENGIGNIT